ncbi:MAG: cation:proton antiporter [Rhodothermales bacterium]
MWASLRLNASAFCFRAVDLHVLTYLIAGLALLGMAALPRLLSRSPLSLPVLYIGFGAAVFALPLGLPLLRPTADLGLAHALEYATELVVIIALAGTGLQIDRRPGWASWKTAWKLLAIAMPLTIAALAVLGIWGLGLSLASAVLLGAVLAPTDPVLANDVQVGPPNEGGEDEVRFGLTTEAGLNDGLAFPFTYLAIALIAATAGGAITDWDWLVEWLAFDVLYRIAVGVAVGVGVGWCISHYVFKVSGEPEAAKKNEKTHEGLLILAGIALSYGLAELAHGYGFLSVFAAAVAGRGYNPKEEFNTRVYRFTAQTEEALTAFSLVVLGGLLIGAWQDLTWMSLGVALVFVLVVRPMAGYLASGGCGISNRERWALAFFGVRGVGSLYYLAFAQTRGAFDGLETVWATVLLTVVCSAALHGATASPAMRKLDLQRGHIEPEAQPIR